MEDKSAFSYQKKKATSSVILDLIFSHVGLFFVVIFYAVLGAMAMMALEDDEENRQKALKVQGARGINQTMTYLTQKLWQYQKETNWSFLEFSGKVVNDLDSLEMSVIDQIDNNKYDGTIEGWTKVWTFAKSLLLTMTIITTIGYGHISPVTFYGQMFVVVYALVGCPLLLLFLANVGDSMAEALIYLYSRWCCRWCRSRRNVSEAPKEEGKKQRVKLLIDEDVGEEEYMPTSNVNVPIIISLVLLTFYIVFGALLFVAWEGWTFHSACYFTFITISTIGYGDMYPQTVMVDDLAADFVETCKMIIVTLYILFGMALLSMSINLMQDQLLNKAKWLALEIGLIKDAEQEALEKEQKKEKKKEEKEEKKRAKKAKKAAKTPDDIPKVTDEIEEINRRESIAPDSVPY